tara:strand:+ start:4650 stop:5099 length:450 start_codon:yes stop_codon:yes gene_type:complete
MLKNNKNMKIAIGGDHASPDLKEFIIGYLQKEGYEVEDFGTNSSESVDYPDFGHKVARSIYYKYSDLGIVICGSGNGINMSVNKWPNLRSALCWNTEIAELARQHNDANILALPARFVSLVEGLDIVKSFLNTEFEGGRHQRRIDKITL